LEFLDNGPSAVADVTDPEMFMFLVIIIQMGHEYMTTGKTGG
jgi:hypothetical protein